MTKRQRAWRWDWAGPHGTAWGTVNACLTTVAVACAGWVFKDKWPATTLQMIAVAVVGTAVGIVVVLVRSALRSERTPPVTIVYQVACWLGVGIWIARVYVRDEWSWRWFIEQLGVLAVLAVVAGLAAWLASDPLTRPASGPGATVSGGVASSLVRRNTLAVEWEDRIQRVVGIAAKVPNVEAWQSGNGYSVEAVCPPGGSSWRDVEGKMEDIAADLDLEVGCRASVQMGRSRRVAIIDVMTKSALADERPYPDDYGPLSIEDPLPVGVRDDGSVIGPDLRSKCMLLVGETGSGKTNAGHDVGVGVARTVDALLWDIDMTGGGLFLPLLRPYLDGRVRQPAVDWAAWDEHEAMLMTRAAQRAGHARKAGYQDLMRKANDDKVPVSDALPAVILRMDEIAKVTGKPSHYPQLSENIDMIVFELRASAFRVVLLGLRATADIVGPDIQAQCHVIAVMRAKNASEYAWAFGWHSGADPADAPYPGCGFIALESGARPTPMKWWRLRPNQLEEIAVAVDGRKPEMDELTRLALDGRNPDGTPMPDLRQGELDCYSTRWGRFRGKFGGGGQTVGSATGGPAPAAPADNTAPQVTVSPQQAMADLATVMAELDRAVAEAKANGVDVPEPEVGTVDVDEDAWAMVLQSWDADPFVSDREPQTPTGEPPTDGPTVMLGVIETYGERGVGPKELLSALAGQGIVIHRDTLHAWLRDAIQRGEVERPRQGKYVRKTPEKE